MADSEFLASFKVEIDDTGVERLQDALSQNRALAEELAAAFPWPSACGDSMSSGTAPTPWMIFWMLWS